jgi:hypothetical protein
MLKKLPKLAIRKKYFTLECKCHAQTVEIEVICIKMLESEEFCLMRYNVLLFFGSQTTFRGNTSLPSSWLKYKPSKKST